MLRASAVISIIVIIIITLCCLHSADSQIIEDNNSQELVEYFENNLESSDLGRAFFGSFSASMRRFFGGWRKGIKRMMIGLKEWLSQMRQMMGNVPRTRRLRFVMLFIERIIEQFVSE